MRLEEHKARKFDPEIRIEEAKTLYIAISPMEWCIIEKGLGRHISGSELKEVLLGIFDGSYKVQKR